MPLLFCYTKRLLVVKTAREPLSCFPALSSPHVKWWQGEGEREERWMEGKEMNKKKNKGIKVLCVCVLQCIVLYRLVRVWWIWKRWQERKRPGRKKNEEKEPHTLLLFTLPLTVSSEQWARAEKDPRKRQTQTADLEWRREADWMRVNVSERILRTWSTKTEGERRNDEPFHNHTLYWTTENSTEYQMKWVRGERREKTVTDIDMGVGAAASSSNFGCCESDSLLSLSFYPMMMTTTTMTRERNLYGYHLDGYRKKRKKQTDSATARQ